MMYCGILSICLFLAVAAFGMPTNVNAFFRQGQTFITWTEVSAETYRVYRSSHQISDLSTAVLIAEIPQGSAKFREMYQHSDPNALVSPSDLKVTPVARYYVNDNVMLNAGQGFFVHTVHETETHDYYYAVTSVNGGVEDSTLALANRAGPISEVKDNIEPVEWARVDDRVWYVMYLDYQLFKNNYMGYGFPFSITGDNFTTGGAMPKLHLDGHGTIVLTSADYSNYGLGDYASNGTYTWYSGYHSNTAYLGGNEGVALQDTIYNFVQYRIMQALLWARRHYNITDPKVNMFGHSMGGSGAFGFFMHFPGFFTSVCANEGMTDYRRTTTYNSDFNANWGAVSLNNPVKNLPFNSSEYPGLDWYTQCDGMGIYDFKDVAEFLRSHTGTDFGLLNSGHSTVDGSIVFSEHGAHFEEYIKDSRHCFAYYVHNQTGHTSSASVSCYMENKMRWDESRPGFSNVPPVDMYDTYYSATPQPGHVYNSYTRWGIMNEPYQGKVIEETDSSWSLPIGVQRLRWMPDSLTMAGIHLEYTVDITPRNLQVLRVFEGDTFSYEILNMAGTSVERSGEIIGDSLNLLLIPNVPITEAGRLVRTTLKARGSHYSLVEKLNAGINDLAISAYPNPFNPTVNICIAGAAASQMHVRIFDASGQMIANLTGGLKNNSVTWDAGKFHSGIYFITVESGSRVVTKRVVLVK